MIRTFRNRVMTGVVLGAMAVPLFAQTAQQGTEQTSGQASAVAIPADQQPSQEQLAKLFEVMRLKEQMQSMRQIVPGMVQQQIQTAMKQTEASLPSGTKLTDEQRQQMQQVMTKYVGKAMDLYPGDEMLKDMGAIYQRHLSKDDVDGMIGFYNSPAGQHLLDAQPLIAKEYMPMVMGKVAERSQAMTREMMKEMAGIVPAAKPSGGKTAAKQGTTKPQSK